MKFVDESNLPQEAQPVGEDQPVNVGIRIKKLKTAEPDPIPEKLEEPVAVVFDTPATEVTESDLTHPGADAVSKIKSGRGRKSIRQIAEEADLILIPEDEVLYRKQYYTMGEVAEMFRVNQSLLRFWEAEFTILQPKKNKKGDRYFRPIDIKNPVSYTHLTLPTILRV